ncbi:MAG: 3-isopropylmalate dehydrogenase [Hirschia sp.]|nr:3-isopropylmalate dehydrogenase [Hirschia sp.]MBF18716.1 3-isopropylmalate dehydrogenase [Hirschia sp.]
MTQTFLLLPGDGIGPEVTREARRVLEIVAPDIEVSEGDFGGMSFDLHGTPLTDDVLARARSSDAILMGAVGGPQWANVPRDKRPEMGLLRLRKELDVYANLRPAFCFPALAEASSLKTHLVEGLDIMIVRELTSGVYFGQPKGIETMANGERRGFDNAQYTTSEIRRVAKVAFEIARGRVGKGGVYGGVVSTEKSNVMDSGLLWREEVTKLHVEEFSDVKLDHILSDALAMLLVKSPKDVNVILADNLFGDILSDEASQLTGSIGMLPSAALGEPGTPGLYEPVHGSAPDIAGQGKANPCAAILSVEMALRWSLDRSDAADRVWKAVDTALTKGARTADLGGSLSTTAMGDAVIAEL